VDYDACENWGKHRVVCGFSWLLRVIDHEAVLMDPKLFSSWVHMLVVLLKRRFGRQTSSRWRSSQKNDWIVQVIPQQAIKAIPVLSTRKIVIRRQNVGMALLTTALGLYGGVLWSGELQGFIIHEMMPANRGDLRGNHSGRPPPTSTASCPLCFATCRIDGAGARASGWNWGPANGIEWSC
jgi:hypothetical protein